MHPWAGRRPCQFPLSRGHAAPRALPGREEAARRSPHPSTAGSRHSSGDPGLCLLGGGKAEPCRGEGAFASCRTQELRRVLAIVSIAEALPKAKADAAQRWAGRTGVCTSQDDPHKGWGSPEPPPSSPATPPPPLTRRGRPLRPGSAHRLSLGKCWLRLPGQGPARSLK